MAARRPHRLSAAPWTAVLLLLFAASCDDSRPESTQAPAAAIQPAARPVALRTELTVRSVDGLLARATSFQRHAGIAPMHRVDVAQLRSSLFEDLHLPGLPGAAELTQPARLLILDPGDHGQRALLVISLIDRSALLQGTHRHPPDPDNPQALSLATGEPAAHDRIHVNFLGAKRAAISRDAGTYPLLRNYLADKGHASVDRADAELLIHGNAPYAPLGDSLQRRVADALARGRSQGMPASATTRITRAFESLAATLMQIEQTHARIELEERMLSATVSLCAAPGSSLARFLDEQPQGPLPFAGRAPADALLSAAGRVRLGAMLPLSKDLLAELFAFSPKRRSEARAQLEAVASALNGRVAAALTVDPGQRIGVVLQLGSDRPDAVRAALLRLLRGYTHTPLHAELARRGLAPQLAISEQHAPGIDRIGPWPVVGDLHLSTSADALIVGLGESGKRATGSDPISIGFGFEGNSGWIKLTAPAQAIANLTSALGYQVTAN